MSKPRNRPPIQLAGIQGGSISPDGDRVAFTLEAQDNRAFNFSVPHEAIGEIVAGLLSLANRAAALRPAAVVEAGTPLRVERAFPLDRFLVSGMADGQLVLALQIRGMEHSVLLPRAHAQLLAEALLAALKRSSN